MKMHHRKQRKHEAAGSTTKNEPKRDEEASLVRFLVWCDLFSRHAFNLVMDYIIVWYWYLLLCTIFRFHSSIKLWCVYILKCVFRTCWIHCLHKITFEWNIWFIYKIMSMMDNWNEKYVRCVMCIMLFILFMMCILLT